MTAASHLMAPSDLNYGECGTPLLTFKFYLKDWAEGGYYTTDKPNPRGEIGIEHMLSIEQIFTHLS